jgi:hypothetical protein
MHDPFDPIHHGGIQFAHDHPIEHLGDGFQRIGWTPPSQLGSAPTGCFTCGGFSRGQPYQPVAAPTGPFILPAAPERSPIAIEVHTLRFGNPPWLRECAPTLDAWCERHAIQLHVTRQWDPTYPDPKFCEVDMLRGFLAGSNEWMLYVDADVVVHPSAPRPHFELPGFHIREDTHGRANTRWFAWCQEKFGRTPDPEYLYRNAGVWACDRAAAAAMLAVIELPYHEGIMEQDQWNWWISLAAGQGMPLHILGHEWNRFPKEHKPSWFFHIFAKNKLKHLLKFRQKALLPDPVKPLDGLPPLIDLGPGVVVWPWASGKAEWDELWFSHRSVLKHWSEKDWPLVLLADKRPDWWPGKFIHASRYEDALWLGTQLADQVLWMNDDIFLIADSSPADYQAVPVLEDMREKLGQTLVAPNSWRRGLGQVLMRLHHHRKTTLNYSTHTPYLYQRQKVAEIFRRFGIFYKLPFESAYHNWHATPTYPAERAKAKSPQDMAGKLWINPAFRQVTPAFREEMAARFGSPPEH